MNNSFDNKMKGDEIELRTTQPDYNQGYDGQEDEKEIDLLELAMKLWNQKKKICIWCFIGAILGLVVAFSIPREYDTTVQLAPEIGLNQRMGGGFGAMAMMMGLGGGNVQGNSDAFYPMLYPDVVSSVPFLVDLFNIPVEDIDGTKKVTLREYMEEDTKSPWWSVILGLPSKLIGLITPDDDDDDDDDKEGSGKTGTDVFKLTRKEDGLVNSLRDRIVASVDQKTAVITISVKMQDRMVSAVVADTVVSRLQEYITDYRTNKAKEDLAYAEKLNQEAKVNYYKAQQKYADYLDRNNGLILHSAQTTRERLQNEATLAFNIYNQTAQRVQSAKAKVQENTPVYAVIAPATVPLKPAAPRKLLILVGFVFLSFVACAGWILYGQTMWEEIKHKKFENQD